MSVDVLDGLVPPDVLGLIDRELHAPLAADPGGRNHVIAVRIGAVSDDLGNDVGPPSLSVLELQQAE